MSAPISLLAAIPSPFESWRLFRPDKSLLNIDLGGTEGTLASVADQRD
jgi:hypothetical protein